MSVTRTTSVRAHGQKRSPLLALAVRSRLLASLLGLAAAPAHAVDYYWDLNDTTAGAGGPAPSGTWSALDAALSLDAAGASAVTTHTTTTADRLFFSAGTDATGIYTVTVSGTQNIGRLTFQDGTVNLTGGTIDFGVVAGTIDGDATPDTISSVITGTNGVRFNGGTVTLTGTNTFTGTTSLGGTLAQANVILAAAGGNAISGGALTMGSGSQSTGGGTVTLGAAEQINDTATLSMSSGHYSGSSVFALNGFNETLGGINLGHNGQASSVIVRNGAATDATLTLRGSGTYTTASGDRVGGRSIQNGGAGRLNIVVALTGSGLQTFAGTAPSYTGTTTVESGTLQLWNTSLWASNTTLNGGTVQLHQTLAAPVAAGGNAPNPRTHANTIGGTGGTLRKTGDGTVILSGANTYQGATQIDQGTLRAGSATAFGNNSAVTLANVAGATMDLNGFNISIGSLAGGGTTGGNVTMGAGNLTAGGNNTSTTYAGVISGTGTVTKTGTGTLTLSGANTYSGLTTVSAGTFQLGGGGTTGSIGSAQATVAAGASLAVNRSDAFALNQNVIGDGTLVQRGTGTTTMATNSNIDHVVLEHGRLVTPGTLLTDDITFTNDGGATLQVAGTLQTSAVGAALVTGGALSDTVQIDAGGSMLANGTLGDGGDTLDVAGTLNTAGGSFDLGAGDDFFVFHDNTSVVGNVIGGAGSDTLNANIATSATLSAAQTFETLTKSGAGTLDIAGPGSSDFSTVHVNAGTLAIRAGATLDAPAAGSLATTVAAGATLDVAGSYGCGAGSDTLTVAGTVSGAGTVDLCGGDDTLTLRDGAVLSNDISGGAGAGDSLVLDNAGALALDAAVTTDFELLQKDNAGTATLTGTQSFLGGTSINGGVLDLNGVVETLTVTMADGTVLNVDGTLQAAGATQATITGSTGINTVTVGTTGTLLATGDLGDGDDTLDVAGTLDLGGGAFLLGAGNDNFVVHDGTVIVGTVDGGAGLDTRSYNINTSADLGALVNFEGVTKSGTGVLNITGPGATDLQSVEVLGGTLDIAAGASVVATVGATLNTLVANGATLNVGGAYGCGDGDDVMTVSGTVSGSGTVDFCGGADTLTIQDGANLSALAAPVDGGAGSDTLVADIAGSAILGGAIDFETLIKTNTGTFNILGPASSQFDTVLVQGGTLHVGAGATVDPATTVVDAGATLTVDGIYHGTAGGDTFTISGTVNGAGTIDLLAGDDVLTINDGGDISGATNAIDGGSHTPAGDSVVLNFASDGSFAAGNTINFENLVKQNTGIVTVTGVASFSGGTTLNEGGLTVTGGLQTPTVALADDTTLDIEGVLEAAGGSSAGISGSAGANTVRIATGGVVRATGDLGAGADTLDVSGTLDLGSGTFFLGDGDDSFLVRDASVITGTVDGGAGSNTLVTDIAGNATLGALLNFATLNKVNTGTLHIDGPAASVFSVVNVSGGTLAVGTAGSIAGVTDTTVAAGATLNVDGAFQSTAGADQFALSGALTGSGAIDLLGGDDVLTVNTGASIAFTGVFDAGPATADRFVLLGAGSDSFDMGLVGTVFRNFDEFRKEGAGTWRLTGSGDRNWTVAEGTLIGNSATFGGDIENAATVVFDQGGDGTFDGVLSGGGTLIKQSAGTLVMTGASTFAGLAQVAAGGLQVDGVLPGTMRVESGATLSGTGAVGSVTALAGGFVQPGTPAAPFGTLTISGDYSGGGTVRINAELGDASSVAGRLVIQGSTNGANSVVLINQVGGSGAQTSGDGIEIIQVDGSSAPGTFNMTQPVQAGAYEYLLYQGGASDANDWFLRSELADPQAPPDPGPANPEPPLPAFRPGVAGYVLGHQADLEHGFTALGTLRDRVGDLGRQTEDSGHASSAWMRTHASELDLSGKRFEARDLQTYGLHFGADIHGREAGGGAREHWGVMFSLGESSVSFDDPARAVARLVTSAGTADIDAKGGGFYWTRYSASGSYLDLTVQGLHYTNDYRDRFGAASEQDGWGTTAAAEVGSIFTLGGTGWQLEPQLQLAYQRLELDQFSDAISSVSEVNDDALRGRAVVQVLRAPGKWLSLTDASPYLALGVQHDFRDVASVGIGGAALRDQLPHTTGEVSAGFTGSMKPGLELHLDVRYQAATEGERDGLRANFGFRMQF